MLRRLPKARGPSSSKNTITVDDLTNSPQDLAAAKHQLDSDNNEAPKGLDTQTLQK
jgi:hypothetical protein